MQLSVATALPGLQRGQLVGHGHKIVSRFNVRTETRTATVVYGAAGTTTISVTGTPYNGGTVAYTASVTVTNSVDSATTAALLKAAMIASPIINSIVSVTIVSNVLTIVARLPGGLTVAGSSTAAGGSNTIATTISEEQLESGIVVVKDSSADLRIRRPFTATAKVVTVTVLTAVNTTTYNMVIFFPRTGATYLIEVTTDGSATDPELVTLFVNKINGMDLPVTAADGAGDTIVLTSDVAGENFLVQEATTVLSQADTTPNAVPSIDGITMWPKLEDPNQILSGLAVWPARSPVSIVKKGVIGVYCEAAVTPASTPHYRIVASGANVTLGALRGDSDSGTALLIENAEFMLSAAAGAVGPLAINLP